MMRRNRDGRSRHITAGIVGLALLGVAVLATGWGSRIALALSDALKVMTPSSVSFDRTGEDGKPPPSPKPVVEHVATPQSVKAIYMTQCYAGTPSLRTGLVKLVSDTELNSIVVDLKDYSGTVSFPSATALKGGGCTVSDFRDFVKELHALDIYVIGRLTVFQDPVYTKAHPEEAVQSLSRSAPWKDHKGLSFVEVGSQPFRDYIVALAREAHELGVDEINFDYIRYPSDGDMKDAYYLHSSGSYQEDLEHFFAELTRAVRADEPHHVPVLSADLFGMVTTNTDDLNIGQVLERALPYFDYIAPMVYPSHYPSGFNGYKDVNAHPYDIVLFSMAEAVRRTSATSTHIASTAYSPIASTSPQRYEKPSYSVSKMRPWLQDFDYPLSYTSAMVEAQIKATYDAGLNSWMIWDPANKYDSLRPLLKREE